MSDFEKFLLESKDRVIEIDGDSIRVFVPQDRIEHADLAAAEKSLGVVLPASYKVFAGVCGSGEWCGDFVVGPSQLYPFDEDCGEMEGFVPLVHNVSGVGDYVAWNPRERMASEEWALYYCSHDPFGFGKVANSFEEWARNALEASETGGDLYAEANESVLRTWHEYRARTRKWWQFWI